MLASLSFLSSATPGRFERWTALAVGLGAGVFFITVVPFAAVPVGAVPAFLPIYQSALVLLDLITAVLLFGQSALARSRALLVLAAGYVFSALMAVAHALSFPGLFAPSGLMGAGPQTTAWLYFLWHAGFPLYVIAYARIGPPSAEGAAVSGHGIVRDGALAAALALVPATILVKLSTSGEPLLPAIMSGDLDAPLKLAVATVTWLLGVAALLAIWRRGTKTVLDLWLLVVLCAWCADTLLAAVFNHGRYDLGWYAGRVFGLLANGFVLAALLLENGVLHARLAAANRDLGAAGDALAHANAQLEGANRDLNSFAAAIAHDLQQPLISISAFARVIQRNSEATLSPGDAASLHRIIAAAATADRMIRDLLEFARLGRHELVLEPVDLNEVVQHVRGLLARETEAHGVQWRVDRLPTVQGDEALLSLALLNLLSNAVKYSRRSTPPRVEVDAVEGEGHADVIRVRDNGVGFEMTQSSRLFTPFERLHSAREFEGTGMGLANVHRIMERHRGTVRAESAPGQGACFSLVFPR